MEPLTPKEGVMTTSDCIREILEEDTPAGPPPAGQEYVLDNGEYVKDGDEFVTDTI